MTRVALMGGMRLVLVFGVVGTSSCFLFSRISPAARAAAAFNRDSTYTRVPPLSDPLGKQLSDRAANQFDEAGVRIRDGSWSDLLRLIQHGVGTMRQTGTERDSLPLAERNLKEFGNWMIEAAVNDPEGRTVHETSFVSADRRCRPRKYPWCP